jgi:hypothetical protein
MKNLGLKLFSLLVSILLALYVHSASNSIVRTFVAPVEFRNVSDTRTILSPLNPSALVTVKGPSFIVGRIPSSPPVFSISLPTVNESRYQIQLDPNTLPLPPNLEVLSVEPPMFEVVFDDLIEKELQVVVPRIGSLDDSIRISALVVTPDRIKAVGPRSILKSISSIETEPLDLRSVAGEDEQTLSLRGAPQLTRLAEQSVLVKVNTRAVVSERRIENLPVEIRSNVSTHMVSEPRVVAVVVSGPRSIIAGLKRSEISAFVGAPSSLSTRVQADVSVELPERLRLVSVEPKRVDVVQVNPRSNQGTKSSGRKESAR